MKIHRCVAAVVSAVVVAACGTLPGGPSDEVRQALAPSGKLRVALFEGNPVHAVRDPATGAIKGIGHDLGWELASRLGVPFEPVLYTVFPRMLEGGQAGAWDVAFIGVAPGRRAHFHFTENHLEVEFGYLVPAGSAITAMDAVDRPGVRVAVVAKGTPDAYLTGKLKSATLVRAQGLGPAVDLVKSGRAEVVAGMKPAMYGVSAQLAGSRVLDGRPGVDELALAVPNGRGAAAEAYVARFIDEAKAGGVVKAAIDRAGLRGVVVAASR